jgi:hypothetical protein
VLNGTVNPGGLSTNVTFHYGTDPALASPGIAVVATPVTGGAVTDAQAELSGLTRGTTYYYRITAANAENPVPQAGAILSFTTPRAPGETLALWVDASFGPDPDPADTLLSADPDGDGLTNLVEFAFALDPLRADLPSLAGGNSGLPTGAVAGEGAGRGLVLEYVRRKEALNPGIIYTAQFSPSLDAGSWSDATGTETVQSIDAEWERVTIRDGAGAGQPVRFGRVRVSTLVE